MLKQPTINTEDFLRGGGEMGERIRSFDWTTTPLGAPHRWPQSLKTCIRIMLTSRQPIWIGWGKDLIKFYNDPYRAIVGGKHPDALGKPASYVWREIWRDIEPMLRTVMEKDEGTYSENQLLIMERNGYPEETYYTFSYTPVPGDAGGTAGMICANTDNTDRILQARQLATLTLLGKNLLMAQTPDEVYTQTIDVLAQNPWDFPFAVLYKADGDKLVSKWQTQGSLRANFPEVIEGNDGLHYRHIREVLLTGRMTSQSTRDLVGLPSGPWEHAPSWILHLPIGVQPNPAAILTIGLNPYRQPDEQYVGFFQLAADQIASRLTQVRAMEEERRRAEALAEIDRAKTVFFSNISHEFRTPLTLMLGPIEEMLANNDGLSQVQLATLNTAHRNALRLLKLVNTLLDFSRLESGRQKPTFVHTDIGELTRNLASNFRSVIEKAGLQYEVAIPDQSLQADIDKNFWETILLNLLSNAFKFTLKGKITVRLHADREMFVARVEDTGVGIPAAELPRMFQRFHRVQDTKGRTHEGTGIGLSMVKELVQLMNGTIDVRSEEGKGTAFTVALPIKQEAIAAPTDAAAQPLPMRTSLYVEEAGMLLPDTLPRQTTTAREQAKTAILVVDDNADMRSYLESLLHQEYNLYFAGDGRRALDIMLATPPALVISDIMMPVMDGTELVKAAKANRATARIPIILLSARAGEEARIEGYEIGADDYLVKPFSARELQARVRAQLNIAHARSQVERKLESLFVQAPVSLSILRGSEMVIEFINDAMLKLLGRTREAVIGQPVFDALPDARGQGFEELLQQVFTSGERYVAHEAPATLERFGKLESLYVKFVFEPLFEDNGTISGVMVVADEVTAEAIARRKIEESDSRQRIAMETAELGAWDLDFDTGDIIRNLRYAQIFGYDNVDKTWSTTQLLEHIHADDRQLVNELFTHPRSGFANLEVRIMRADAAIRWIRGQTKVFYNDNGEPRRMVGAIQDITDQKLATEELERKVNERTQNLKAANLLLERTNHELEQFAYIASHDLQEPLRKIQTFVSFLNNSQHDPVAFNKYYQKILGAAQRMSRLIQDVLHYSRLTKDVERFTPVDLNVVLEQVRVDFELLIAEKRGTITAGHLPTVYGIPLQLGQLFTNLVGNALKFCSEEPDIAISTRILDADEVRGNSALDPVLPYCEISFADNGIGFEQQYAEQIFQIFQRLQSDYHGTGIGLALCKKIVENHYGSITANSQAGKGSTFVVCLPLALPH